MVRILPAPAARRATPGRWDVRACAESGLWGPRSTSGMRCAVRPVTSSCILQLHTATGFWISPDHGWRYESLHAWSRLTTKNVTTRQPYTRTRSASQFARGGGAWSSSSATPAKGPSPRRRRLRPSVVTIRAPHGAKADQQMIVIRSLWPHRLIRTQPSMPCQAG